MKRKKSASGSPSLDLKRFEIAALITLLLLLVSPLFTSAQTVDELQAQIQALLARVAALQGQMVGTSTPTQPPHPGDSDDYPTPTSIPSCPNLSITMQRGSRDATTGGQVTELQVFLANHFDLDEEDVVSGYFGKLTQQLVTKFQNKYGLPAFGIVGSLTRAKIAQVCAGVFTNPPRPIANFSATPASGQAPLTVTLTSLRLSAGSGPYQVTFGDGSSGYMSKYACYDGTDAYTSGTCDMSVTHTYASAGSYSANLWSGSGQKTPIGTATITVTDAVGGPSITVTAPNGGEVWELGITNTITWTPYGYAPDVNPAKDVTAYLEKKVGTEYKTIGTVMPQGMASIHWSGEIAEIDTYGK